MSILDKRMSCTNACFFCEYDVGPLGNIKPQCKTCFNFNNFQLKKRMHPRQYHEWLKFKEREGEES